MIFPLKRIPARSVQRQSHCRSLRVLAIAVAMVAASCSSSEPETAPESQPEPDTTFPVQTTPEGTPLAPSDTIPAEELEPVAVDALVTDPDECPTYQPGDTSPLTGLAYTDEAAATRPAIVVKVSNNNSRSRDAMVGLDQADIVFEERIEDRATRFAAVFHAELPEIVGPVRSARSSDVDIVSGLGSPVLAYSGSNRGVGLQMRAAAGYGALLPIWNLTDSEPFARDSDYSAPDNLFVASDGLISEHPGCLPPTPIFSVSTTDVVHEVVPAIGVVLDGREASSFLWQPETQLWQRFQNNEPSMSRDGGLLTYANVVVLFVNYQVSPIDSESVDAITTGRGTGWVLVDGGWIDARWERDTGQDPYVLTTAEGNPLTLDPGRTWTAFLPAGQAGIVTQFGE